MKCEVRWTGHAPEAGASPMGFEATTGSGHVLRMDGAPNADSPNLGGINSAARPMEMVLAGTGGCTAYDVVLILKRGRQDVLDCAVHIDADRAETDPKVFTRIHMKFVVSGRKLSRSAVERAVALSHEKYCSASAMLAKTAQMTHEVELVELA